MTNETENSVQIDFSVEELNMLGLTEHPFIEHAGDNYLFSDSQLDMTSNIIMEYLDNPTTTIVLTGEEGLGKTTFLRKILRLGYQQYQFCTLRANQQTSFEDVEEKIKQRWPLASTEVATPPEDLSIENYVISYLSENSHAVLIIDDADHLDLPTLDRLFALKHRVALALPNGLGLILAGENTLINFIAELEETNPACTQVYQINVRPLTREQTYAYIKSRLATAGLEEDILFDDAQLANIYDLTEGNITLIHEVSTSLLATKRAEGKVSFTDILDENVIIRKPKSRLPLILIPLVLLIGLGLYFNSKQTSNEVDEIALPTPDETINTPISSLLEDNNNIDEPEHKVPATTKPISPKVEDEVKIAEVAPIPENLPPLEEKTSTPPAEDSSKKIEEPVKIKQVTETKEKTSNTDKKISEQTTKAEVATKKEVTPTNKKPSSGVDWLKSLPATDYTLQVIATSDVKKLQDLVKKEKLTERFALFKKIVKGQTYHVLVVGNYATRVEAASSVAKLSATLRKNKPWPIKLDQVQKHL